MRSVAGARPEDDADLGAVLIGDPRPDPRAPAWAAATPMHARLAASAAFASIQSAALKSWTSPPSFASYGLVSKTGDGHEIETPRPLVQAVSTSLPTELMTRVRRRRRGGRSRLCARWRPPGWGVRIRRERQPGRGAALDVGSSAETISASGAMRLMRPSGRVPDRSRQRRSRPPRSAVRRRASSPRRQ
jgi:hypothetical protein